jgi:hypothetical protein
LTEFWSIKLVATAIETPPELNFGQGVFHCALQTLHCDLIDIHKLTPKIQEVIAFTRWLTDKEIQQKCAVWNVGYIAIFGPLEQLSPQLQILCKFAHLYTMTSGTISLLEVGTNSALINSEKMDN